MKQLKKIVSVMVMILMSMVMISLTSYAQITSNPIISRGKPAFSSSGDASTLVDNIFGYGVFSISNGSWVAIEVGDGPSEVYVAWNAPVYSWSDVIAAETSCKQNPEIPIDYTLQISSNSTNGSDGDWTTVDTITGNTVTNRGHLISFDGASWVKIAVSSGTGSFDEVEVFDVSGGGTDSWFFPGTSISANAFKGSVPENNFADVVAENYPGFTPIMIRGGIPCINSTSFANDIDLYIEMAGNVKYWAIEMGTNDAWGGSDYNVETFRSNMQIVIDKCKANGIEPIIARMIGTNEDAAGWQVHPDFLTAIDELTAENNLMPGPDFYTWFSTHPDDLTSDGVHPSESGCASMQQLWAEHMVSLYTGSTVPVQGIGITPTSLSIIASQSYKLTANVLPANATNRTIVWSSENPDIVSVDDSGTIQAVSEGVTNIIATTADGGFTALCEVTVISDSEDNSEDDSASAFSTCESHTAMTMPFEQNGIGEYCWVASGTVEFVNSWNLDYLEINGADFTNTYASTLPAKIDGNYYIHYISSLSWGHFEMAGSDDALSE